MLPLETQRAIRTSASRPSRWPPLLCGRSMSSDDARDAVRGACVAGVLVTFQAAPGVAPPRATGRQVRGVSVF